MASASGEVSPGFEGVEKVVEIDFAPGLGPANGLLAITREDWDAVLSDAKCTILDSLASASCTAYVLSESSLFVYPLKMVIKTCGTTTLLAALPRLLEITLKLAMRVEWVAYTRKDFKFPQAQKFPHRGPQEEIGYLKELFPEGSAFLMGPVTGDHWLVFVADYVDRATEDCVDRTLDIMMFDLDPEVRGWRRRRRRPALPRGALTPRPPHTRTHTHAPFSRRWPSSSSRTRRASPPARTSRAPAALSSCCPAAPSRSASLSPAATP